MTLKEDLSDSKLGLASLGYIIYYMVPLFQAANYSGNAHSVINTCSKGYYHVPSTSQKVSLTRGKILVYLKNGQI